MIKPKPSASSAGLPPSSFAAPPDSTLPFALGYPPLISRRTHFHMYQAKFCKFDDLPLLRQSQLTLIQKVLDRA